MPRQRKTYTGELARPIPHIPFGHSLAELSARDAAELEARRAEAENVWIAKMADARMEKMAALFKHYGIAEGNYVALAFALADAHVPGIAIAKARAGAPERWNPITVAVLRLHIDELRRRNPRLSERAAADSAARSGIWKDVTRGAAVGATLLRRVKDADDRFVQIVSDAYRQQSERDSPPTVSSVEEFVRKWVAPQIRTGGNPTPSISA